MKYAKIKDGVVAKFPYDMNDLMEENPYTKYHSGDVYSIFPTTNEYLLGYSLVLVNDAEPIEINNDEDFVNSFAELENGVWVEKWNVRKLSEEEYAKKVNSKWMSIRSYRNRLLTESDWTQMPDSPVQDSLWHPYRQALRDITLQDDPFNLVWPKPPG